MREAGVGASGEEVPRRTSRRCGTARERAETSVEPKLAFAADAGQLAFDLGRPSRRTVSRDRVDVIGLRAWSPVWKPAVAASC